MDFCIQDNEIYYINENGEKAAEVTFPSIDADSSRGNFQTGEKGSAHLFVCHKLV